MNKKIYLFRPEYRTDEVLEEIRKCLDIGWTGLGYKTLEFEKAWCEYTGLPHSHFLNSGTAGLHLAIKLFKKEGGWKEGDEIITTPITFVSTNHAILYERLTPVFADVDDTLCLDPLSVEKKITKKTRAIMFVGIGGNAGRLIAIKSIALKKKLKLIVDAAHMAGTRLGYHIGHAADVSVFSFHSVKNLPTADSGMICCRDPELDREVRKWTWLGINKDTYSRGSEEGNKYKWNYEVEHVGYKYHGNSIMAAIGLVSLKYLDRDNAYRRQIAHWYDELLAYVYKNKKIQKITMDMSCESSRHLYQILVDNRDKVIEKLNEHGIYPGVHYRDNTEYEMYKYADGTCPKAREYSNRLLSLPMHLQLTYNDVCYIVDKLIGIVVDIKR